MDKYNKTILNKSINQRSVYYMDKKVNSKSVHTPSLTAQKQIVELTNEVALYLYNYYISKAVVTHFNLLDDVLVGRSIGWTPRKVKDNRLKLSRAGLIYLQQRKLDGVLHSAWVFGLDKVRDYKSSAADISIAETISDAVHLIAVEA